MLELAFNEKELKEINGNRELMRNVLISRALYNESLKVQFNEEQEKEMWFLAENEIMRLYMDQKIEKRIFVNENSIIESYNQNKERFEKEGISFAKAREIIENELIERQNFYLSEDLVKKLIDEMSDNISISKEDLKFSHGDPAILKTLILINLLNENASKTDFFEKNSEIIKTIKENVRLNYFIELQVRANLQITEEEINEIYKNEAEKLKNYSEEEAKQIIVNELIPLKAELIKNEIARIAYENNKISEIIDNYLGKEDNNEK